MAISDALLVLEKTKDKSTCCDFEFQYNCDYKPDRIPSIKYSINS